MGNIRPYLGNVVEEFLPVLIPYLRGLSASVWEQSLPVAVVTPSAAKAQMVKSALHAAGVPLIGVEFWQPADLRRELSRVLGVSAPLSDARLVSAGIRTVAMKIAEADAQNGTAKALAKSAQALADTIAMLEAAGWDYTKIHVESLRSIAEGFHSSMAQQGQSLVGASDFGLLSASRKTDAPIAFHGLALVGFDGLHWEYWPVLAASALLSNSTFLTLPIGYDASGDADMVWCSSWEQLAGREFESVDSGFVGNAEIGQLSDHLDIRTAGAMPASAGVPVEFIGASSLVNEARRVVLKAAQFLQADCKSIGILVPGPGSLAREITLALGRNRIEHYTTIPGYSSPVPHSGSWPALLQALADNSSDSLGIFLRTNGDLPTTLTGGQGSIYIANKLDRYASEMLITHIPVLRTMLGTGTLADSHKQTLKDFLTEWPDLPDAAPFGEYLDAVQSFLVKAEWHELALCVADAKREQAAAAKMILSREAACEWLRISLPARRAHRNECNGNPYARVQVVTPTDAVGRVWDVLIFSGQVEGAWPPPLKPAGYLGEDAVRLLNNEARKLNAEALTTGQFGEGTAVVKEDKGFCVGPIDQRLMYVRDLIRLLKSVRTQVVFSAAATDETDNGKILQPGDFYRRVYMAIKGENIDATLMHRMALTQQMPADRVAPLPIEVDTSAITKAWKARNSGDVLSEYEFTLGGEESHAPITISPSAWGHAFKRPAEVFLAHFIGVNALNDPSILNIAPAQGIWTHAFVEQTARTAKRGDAADWVRTVDTRAFEFMSAVDAALKQHKRQIPLWWKSVFSQALSGARHFAKEAGRMSEGMNILTEASIPATPVKLESGKVLTVSGRLDLLLSSTAIQNGVNFVGGVQKIVDFKTGSDEPLKGANSICSFKGLQLALYILALKARGGGDIGGAILPIGTVWSDQVSNVDLDLPQCREVLERMADMQLMGLFGWTGTVRDAYANVCNYPLATLPPIVSASAKFKKTHKLD